jgi:CheY-like chemotaxis protein
MTTRRPQAPDPQDPVNTLAAFPLPKSTFTQPGRTPPWHYAHCLATLTIRATPVRGDLTIETQHISSKPAFESRPEPPLIAVVDDDASFRKALGRLVSAWGFRAWTFASAEEYLRIGVPTDCLVLDLHLEGMSGLELQGLLSRDQRVVPIIFVTAMDDPIARRRAMDGGAVAYLEKPFDEYRLLEVLQAVTGYRQA